jgi:hypothetical protein
MVCSLRAGPGFLEYAAATLQEEAKIQRQLDVLEIDPVPFLTGEICATAGVLRIMQVAVPQLSVCPSAIQNLVRISMA